MAYNPLSQDSGGDAVQRRAEADRIIRIIRDAECLDSMTDREQKFVNEASHAGSEITVKMIFWLRDLKDRYAT